MVSFYCGLTNYLLEVVSGHNFLLPSTLDAYSWLVVILAQAYVSAALAAYLVGRCLHHWLFSLGLFLPTLLPHDFVCSAQLPAYVVWLCCAEHALPLSS